MSVSYERQINIESYTGEDEYQRYSWLAEWQAFIARRYSVPLGKKIVFWVAIFLIILLVILIAVAASHHGSTNNLPLPTPTSKRLPHFSKNILDHNIFTNTSSIILGVKNVKNNSSIFRQLLIEGDRQIEDISTPFMNTVASLDVDLHLRCLWFTAFEGNLNRTISHNKRGLFHMCKSIKDAKVQFATNVEGIGLMMEGIDWIGHNIYLFNSSAISVIKSNSNFSETFELRTKSADIHQLSFPSGLRVDPINGYIFWSSLGGSGLQPHIGRSNMDGRHSMPIVLSEYARTIALDISKKKLYFVSMMKELDALMSVDYNGNSMKTIQVQSHHKDVFKHTFKLSLVSGDPDVLIWNNGGHRLVSGKLQGDNLQNVTLAYETKSDEIIVAFVALYLDTQPQVKDSNCNQEDFCPDGICLRLPVTRNTGTVVEEKCRTHGRETNVPSSQCSAPELYYCSSDDKCIVDSWRCDGTDDCSDGEDENNCGETGACREGHFACNSTNACIPDKWKCDAEEDCKDGSDEVNCPDPPNCDLNEFQCKSNGLCFSIKWQCDGEDDCPDGSDEDNCG